MKTLFKWIPSICIIICLSYSVSGEVVKISMDTDSTWRSLDVEDQGWTEAKYNDSWWESAANRSMAGIGKSSSVWYPSVSPKTAYFRKDFVIDNLSIISANLYFGVAEKSNGSIDLYVNGGHVGKFYNTTNNPNMADISPFLLEGKNVVASKVEEQDQFSWSMTGEIRYRGAGSENNTTSFGSEFEKSFQNIQSYGTIAPQNTGLDASVTIRSILYKGYDVSVDGAYIGSDGKSGDRLDGVYSFKVTGNQPHTIRVDHPFNWKYWSFWYMPGENYTYDF